jgi:hypothetical protein
VEKESALVLFVPIVLVLAVQLVAQQASGKITVNDTKITVKDR